VRSRPTPFLLVDRDRLSGNVAAMAALARQRGVALRPHAKTHKCAEVARLQTEAGTTGLTVATVSEAQAFADAGFRELFLAYPLWVDAAKGARLRRLAEQASLLVGVDSVPGVRALATQLPGCAVLLEVDSGHHRSGVQPAEAGDLAESALHCGLEVRGVFTFPGHSYAPGAAADVAAQEAVALGTAAAAVSGRGIDVQVVSGGSTPSAGHAHADVLTELRPGVYVFGDAQQWELGTTTRDRIALTCVATVVSRADGRVVLDSGSKVLGPDRAPWATGNGRLLDHPDARVTALSEHHAVVAWPPSSPAPELGTRLRVVPNHVCTAVNLADELVVTGPDAPDRVWPVAARGCNT
jgi:D-serine deaminase-like pyridoxal phosphate-dependent protein